MAAAKTLTPAQVSLRARMGNAALQAGYDIRETCIKPMRAARWQGFLQEVDPEGTLPEAERIRRAKAAEKAYMTRLAYKSSRARSRQK